MRAEQRERDKIKRAEAKALAKKAAQEAKAAAKKAAQEAKAIARVRAAEERAAARKAAAAEKKRLAALRDPEEIAQDLLQDAQRLEGMGDYDGAKRYMNQYLEQFPTDPRGDVHMGSILVSEGNRKGALNCFKSALKKDPNDPNTLWRKSEVHLAEATSSEPKPAEVARKKSTAFFARKRGVLAAAATARLGLDDTLV